MFHWDELKLIQGDFGDREKIHLPLVECLNDFANNTGLQLIVTAGTQGEHLPNSFHYQGLAIDFMVPKLEKKDLPDLLFTILRYPFMGVGIYSEWRLASTLPSIGGFHVDFRATTRKNLWLKGRDGYMSMNTENIQKYFL